MRTISNFLRIFIFLLFGIFCYSCKKEDQRQNLPVDKIAEAKDWYTAQIKQSTVYLKTGKTDSVLISREPLWDSLETLTVADQSLVLVVPVKTNLFEITKKEGVLNLVISYSETQKEFRLLNKFKNSKTDTVKLNATQLYQMAFPNREAGVKLNFKNVDAKGLALQLPKVGPSESVTMSTCLHHFWVEKYWVDGVVVHEEWTYLYSSGCGENGGPPGEQFPTPEDGAPEPTLAPRDITVNTTDACITKTVIAALMNNKNVMGIMADIIKKFDSSKSVKIDVFDGQIYYKNANGSFVLDNYGNKIPKPGETTNQQFNGNAFSASITLGIDYHKETSKESLITTMIHEMIHAYLKYTGDNTLSTAQHNTISEKYITPMAEYLSSTFGIDLKDAYALAWSGVPDANAWNNASLDFQFSMSDGRKITKQETINLSGPYKEKEQQFAKGIKICD